MGDAILEMLLKHTGLFGYDKKGITHQEGERVRQMAFFTRLFPGFFTFWSVKP